jgi:trans-feruloyl-CoA hydratase/vanillin synthase
MSTFDPSRFPDLDVVMHAGGVLQVALSRPAKKNAIGVEMTMSLERLFQRVSLSETVRIVVIHGAGGNFSAGMDMRDFFAASARDPGEIARARRATDHWRARQIRALRQPVFCAVQGYCLGGAFPLLEAADWVVAAEDAIFGLPEINFNFVPGGPIAKSLVESLSRRGASYAALTGRNFSASQALDWGLVHQVGRADEVIDTVLARASHLTQGDLAPRRTSLEALW